jgi:hypothetical protein
MVSFVMLKGTLNFAPIALALLMVGCIETNFVGPQLCDETTDCGSGWFCDEGGECAEVETGRLRVDVYGWGPGVNGQETLMQGIPPYDDALDVRVLLTRPDERRVLAIETAPVTNWSAAVPDVPGGDGLRLDMEVVNSLGETVASGATQTFDFVAGEETKALRLMVSPTNTYSPSASQVLANGEVVLVQSRLDYRAHPGDTWLGRTGHAAVPTSTGKVLVVGGADVVPGGAPGSLPSFRSVYSDVQIYDPETGYFSDLAFNESLGTSFPDDANRLTEARAYHTVTPLGGDRFLVAGGVNMLADRTLPVTTVELIDLNAPAGEQVKPLETSDGSRAFLNVGRGWHTAHYYPETDQVVVIGGLGKPTADAAFEPLATMEVINVGRANVASEVYSLSTARTDHDSTLLPNGTIWVMGGRDASGALASTESVTRTQTGLRAAPNGDMNTARFGFDSILMTGDSNSHVLVVGGYTGPDQATAAYEVGTIDLTSNAGEFVGAPSWTLARARGNHGLVRLPQTSDVMVLGGTSGAGDAISTAERMSFKGLAEATPYDVISSGVGEALVPRHGATMTLMTNGRVLVFGGVGERVSGNQTFVIGLDDAEIYNPRDPVAGMPFE